MYYEKFIGGKVIAEPIDLGDKQVAVPIRLIGGFAPWDLYGDAPSVRDKLRSLHVGDIVASIGRANTEAKLFVASDVLTKGERAKRGDSEGSTAKLSKLSDLGVTKETSDTQAPFRGIARNTNGAPRSRSPAR
jgi:hypothetical protein